MKLSICTLVLLLATTLSIAQDNISYADHASYTHYKDLALNAKSLSTLTRQQAIQDQMLAHWFSTHHELCLRLAQQPLPTDLADYDQNIKIGNALLEKAGYTNSSKHNFIFAIEDSGHKKYWVKIAGPNRFEQLNARLKRPWGTPLTQEDIASLKDKTQTYQSASRMARYILYQQWKESHPEIPIESPATFLVSLSDTHAVDDAHALIIEEHVDAIGTPKEHPEYLLALKKEVEHFIVQMGLWNINESQFLIKQDGTLVCIDLEDPDNSNPKHFFNANYEKVKHNIRCGLDEFKAMCTRLEQSKKTS